MHAILDNFFFINFNNKNDKWIINFYDKNRNLTYNALNSNFDKLIFEIYILIRKNGGYWNATLNQNFSNFQILQN